MVRMFDEARPALCWLALLAFLGNLLLSVVAASSDDCIAVAECSSGSWQCSLMTSQGQFPDERLAVSLSHCLPSTLWLV